MNPTSRLDILSELQRYQREHEEGNVDFKNGLWGLTKLRRKQNRGMITMEETFSAEQIREELRARTVLRNQNEKTTGEPALVAEGAKASRPSWSAPPSWKWIDAFEETYGRETEHPKNSPPMEASTSSTSSGLRQRKHITDESKNGKGNPPKTVQDPIVTEEESLLRRDPLELFSGVRPGDLKVAQKHAKAALESYIRAANQAATILAQIEQAKKESK